MVVSFVFPEDQFILVGIITKPHGLRGELKLNSFSRDSRAVLSCGRCVLVDSGGKLTGEMRIEKHRHQGKTEIIKFAGVEDRESAEEYNGKGVLVAQTDLPSLGDNEYYWFQFIGLEVRTDDGKEIGRVHTLFNNGAHDIMVVRKGQQELFIPITSDVIQEHNSNGVVITPPPGLLELYQGEDD